MRHGSANRRQRNRGSNSNNGGGQRNSNGNRMQVFDSNGPDVRIRGTAHQVAEKYMTLAKDAASAGDRIVAESYLQHAEHYQRIINSWGEEYSDRRPVQAAVPVDNSASEVSEDDLSLPISILGASADAKLQSVSERTSEMAAE
jgi:hypothetical protein